MKHERLVTGAFVLVLLIAWAGFLVHRSPRFPGSLAGSFLAIAGALLLVLPSIAYAAAKRIPRLRTRFGARGGLARLLSWHVYTGALGAVLVILHTGHRFESTLGMALTAVLLVAVVSGYFGRHLMGRVSLDLRQKQAQLAGLQDAYNAAVAESTSVSAVPSAPRDIRATDRLRMLLASPATALDASAPSLRAAGLAESIAEMEHSITTHERLKRMTSAWLGLHIAAAIFFYALLGAHIWAAIHFGLRWLP